MTPTRNTTIVPSATIESPTNELPKAGEWYWATNERDGRRIGCVVHVGSNYAELEGLGWSWRVHFSDWHDFCERELDPEAVIEREVKRWQDEAQRLMGRVRETTARLCVGEQGALLPHEETRALSVRSGTESATEYKAALIKAKDEDLPALFEELRKAHESMASWMKARMIPLHAQLRKAKGSVRAIEDRVFSVELYAGLVEEAVLVADGAPAERDEKVRLMQRRHYMDEECLAAYEAGGMEFEDIGDFDAWLARPANRDRILPHQRCVVAFRVRRYTKERSVVSIDDFIRMMQGAQADKSTFLYVRNGERVYRIETAVDFGEKLFPDGEWEEFSGPLWARMSGYDVEEIVSDARYQGILEDDVRGEAKEVTRKAEHDAKEADYRTRLAEAERTLSGDALEEWHHQNREPWYSRRFSPNAREYRAWTPATVYHDDIARFAGRQLAEHNRLVLVLQGLLDRSPVLHPHPGWKLYTSDGFEAAVELVRDTTRALLPGDAPDFEAYRARLNESLKEGSVTVGQELVWEKLSAARENARRNSDWRWRRDNTHARDLERYRPHNDPGPGLVAQVARWAPRVRKVTFRWGRGRTGWGRYSDTSDPIAAQVVASAADILCIDAYRPGDFRIFFDDPRTRTDYLKWAPLLLAAEDYHADKRELGKPSFRY